MDAEDRAFLAEGRAEAEDKMEDTSVVEYVSEYGDQDEDTGEEVPIYTTRLTAQCKVQVSSLSLSLNDSDGATASAVAVSEIHYPFDTAIGGEHGLSVGDRIRFIAVGEATMPQIVDRVFRVEGFNPKSHGTKLAVRVSDVL